jgi:hypothetical protein
LPCLASLWRDERRLTSPFRTRSSESLHKHVIDDGRRGDFQQIPPGCADRNRSVKEFIMFKKITIGAALAASTIAAVPAPALAHGGYNDSRYERSYRGDRYYGRSQYDRGYRRCSGTTGMIIGGAGGALLGREIAGRRSRGTGTILGAAAGALLGRQVGKSSCR